MGYFFGAFWGPFFVPLFDASWLHLGPQKWPKRLQDDTSKHLKVLKNHVCFVFFAHRLFRRFDASSCLLGTLLVPTWPLQGRFLDPKFVPKRIQNETPKWSPEYSAGPRNFMKNFQRNSRKRRLGFFSSLGRLLGLS